MDEEKGRDAVGGGRGGSLLRIRGGSRRGRHFQTGSKVCCSETVTCIYRGAGCDTQILQRVWLFMIKIYPFDTQRGNSTNEIVS